MGKPLNIASTSHAQAAEFAAIAGVASQPADTTDLKNALRDALARVESQDAELAAEKAAHAATQAALDAATATKTDEA
jgi:hypothetical protein